MQKVGIFIQRIAGTVRHQVIGQYHRQLLIGHRHIAAFRAMNHWDRRSPITLAGNAPVAQPPNDFLFTQLFSIQISGNGVYRLLEIQTVVLTGIDANPVIGISLLPRHGRFIPGASANHRLNRQAVLLGKGEVALVVRRNRHDCAFAIGHQHIICHP